VENFENASEHQLGCFEIFFIFFFVFHIVPRAKSIFLEASRDTFMISNIFISIFLSESISRIFLELLES
jgi:hypothetical protein